MGSSVDSVIYFLDMLEIKRVSSARAAYSSTTTLKINQRKILFSMEKFVLFQCLIRVLY